MLASKTIYLCIVRNICYWGMTLTCCNISVYMTVVKFWMYFVCNVYKAWPANMPIIWYLLIVFLYWYPVYCRLALFCIRQSSTEHIPFALYWELLKSHFFWGGGRGMSTCESNILDLLMLLSALYLSEVYASDQRVLVIFNTCKPIMYLYTDSGCL